MASAPHPSASAPFLLPVAKEEQCVPKDTPAAGPGWRSQHCPVLPARSSPAPRTMPVLARLCRTGTAGVPARRALSGTPIRVTLIHFQGKPLIAISFRHAKKIK